MSAKLYGYAENNKDAETLQDLDTASAAFVYQALQEVLLVYQRRQEDRQALRSERQRAGIREARKAGRQLGVRQLAIRKAGMVFGSNGRHGRSVRWKPAAS